MPTNVCKLFQAGELKAAGPVPYGEAVPEQEPGVYVVSQTADPSLTSLDLVWRPQISISAIDEWIRRVPGMRSDGAERPPKPEEIERRLLEFWLYDEPVLYIGQTGNSLRSRIRYLYRHRLGDADPHGGGHWLKTLANLDDMFIFWAAVGDRRLPETIEHEMIEAFVRGVTKTVREKLYDPRHPFPWANLEHPRGVRKDHGLRYQTI
jgi:hypothetical protein